MTCFECGDKATEKHHMIPQSLGGTKTIDLCSKCHCKIHGLQGNRINAVDLIKFGVYRKNLESFIGVMAWDVNQISWRLKVDKMSELPKAQLWSYRKYSGDFKLTSAQLQKRRKVIDQWAAEKRWDWFLELVNDGNIVEQALVHRALRDRFYVKKYWREHRKIESAAKDAIVRTDSYHGMILNNIWNNYNNHQSRLKWIRERTDEENEWYKEEQITEQEKAHNRRIQRLFGTFFPIDLIRANNARQ
jgi:hypothetical protein